MKAGKRIIALLVLVVTLAGLLPMEAQAIELIDTKKTCSLTITSKYGDIPMARATFNLYRIATNNELCEFTVTDKFEDFISGDELNKLGYKDPANPDKDLQAEWEQLNQDAMAYVLRSGIEADVSKKTNTQGVVEFNNLPQGLYLVLGEPNTQDKVTYEQKPILLMLPNRKADKETWDYSQKIVNKPGVALNDLKVEKIWVDHNDADKRRPKTLRIDLLKNGVVYDTITLPTKKGEWFYIWEDLEYGHVWTVREHIEDLNGSRYEPSAPVKDENGTELIVWKITNTYVPPERPKELPQTGQLWWPVPVLLVAGLLFMLVGLIRRRGDNREA